MKLNESLIPTVMLCPLLLAGAQAAGVVVNPVGTGRGTALGDGEVRGRAAGGRG